MTEGLPSANEIGRTVGLDSHPDLFSAAILAGNDPAKAKVLKVFDKLPIDSLETWAAKHLLPQDTIVLEASGNSFEIVERLKKVERKAIVLESYQASQIQSHYCVNDKISAVKLGRAWLSGLAKVVWVPDEKTRTRRQLLHVYRNSVKASTRLRNRVRAFLNEWRVRLAKGVSLMKKATLEDVLKARTWGRIEKGLLENLFNDLWRAEEQRKKWRTLIAEEVVQDSALLELTRLIGIRDVLAFAIGAIVGDVKRFANPKKLVAYVGLNGSVQQSGNSCKEGGLKKHGRKDLRALIVQAAHCIMRQKDHPLRNWGVKLLCRKSKMNIAVVAVARKLMVAVWYLMQGRFSKVEALDATQQDKIKRMVRKIDKEYLKEIAKTRKEVVEEAFQKMKERIYILNPNKKYSPAG